MTNLEKLTEQLNACKNRRRIYNALMAMSAKPSIQHLEDSAEKKNVLFAEVVDLVAETDCA